MRRSRPSGRPIGLHSESGSAAIEFLTVGLLLLVPTVYLVIALAALEGAAFGVEGAARQASRVFVQSDSPVDAERAAARAIEVTLSDYGLTPSDTRVTVTCRPNPGACLTRRGFVTVTIRLTVPLPLMPPVLGLDLPTGVPITASSTEQVSRFRGSR